LKKKKRNPCSNLKTNAASCPCPEDCPRRGFCCDCVEFHSAMGEVPFCMKAAALEGANCSAGGPKSAPKSAPPALLKAGSPGFKLINYASCAG
jgi:hypothetical protein